MMLKFLEKIYEALVWVAKHRASFLLPLLLIRIFLCFVSMRIVYLFTGNKITSCEKRKKITISFTEVYYTGNSRAVYEYIQNREDLSKKFDCYWIAKNLHSFSQLRKRGIKCFYSYSLLGIPYFLKTDVWVRTHTGFGEFLLLPHKNYKTIQLWHGTGPKGISFTQNDYKLFDAWCLPSEFVKRRHIELWDAPPEKLFVTGEARLDMLLNYLKEDVSALKSKLGIHSDKKVILYAPTYDIGLWPWGDPYEEFEKLCDFCNRNELVLILRLHPYAKVNRRRIKKIISKYPSSVYWIDMKDEPDTMLILAISDILITDWSSIYTDFFLTGRPIIYLEVEKTYYTSTRGKGQIPPNYRAGEIVKNQKEFYKVLEKVVTRDHNPYQKQQKKLLRIIHGEIDGRSSERVIKLIESILKNKK